MTCEKCKKSTITKMTMRNDGTLVICRKCQDCDADVTKIQYKKGECLCPKKI